MARNQRVFLFRPWTQIISAFAVASVAFSWPTRALPSKSQRQAENAPQTESGPVFARQAGWSAAELAATASFLDSKNPARRTTAIAVLSRLDPESLPAIRTRIRKLAAETIERSQATAVLESIAQTATETASSAIDGVEQVLTRMPTADVRAVTEASLLLHAVAAMDRTAAGLLLAHWVPLYGGAFEGALERVRNRAGRRLLPALIILRSHHSQEVKHWAQAGMAALAANDPLAALNERDPKRLAEVVRAYATPPDLEAMPLLVRLAGHRHGQVRFAARAALARFGEDAVWQLRKVYKEVTGQRADPSWAAQRLAQALYAQLDRPQTEADERALARGLDRFRASDLPAMQRHFDQVLQRWPGEALQTKMVLGYEALAETALARNDLGGAEAALQMALFLAPPPNHAEQHSASQAQLMFVRAQQDLSRGVVDRYAYQRVLDLMPGHAGARETLRQLAVDDDAPGRPERRWLVLAALLLLCGGGLLLGWAALPSGEL